MPGTKPALLLHITLLSPTQNSVKKWPYLEQTVSIDHSEGKRAGWEDDVRIIPFLAVLFRLLGVFVELTGVTSASLDRRDIRCVNVFLEQSLPCNLGKPRMIFHVGAAPMQVAQSLGQIGGDQLNQKILGIVMNVGWIFDPSSENILVNLDRRAAVPERREATKHLKNQDAQGPPKPGLI